MNDGKNLGRVCDMSFCYPENSVKGFTVTGGRGLRFMREEQFVPWNQIVKIGEDVILVKREAKGGGHECPPPCPPGRFCPPHNNGGGFGSSRRDTEDYE